MQHSEYFHRSLNARDISGIRGALLGIIDKNPGHINLTEMKDALEQVTIAGIRPNELYEKDDEELNTPNPDYYQARAALNMNFSKEKLQTILDIAGYKPAPSTQRYSDSGEGRYSRGGESRYEEGRNSVPFSKIALTAGILIILIVFLLLLREAFVIA